MFQRDKFVAPFVHFELRREHCIEAGERTQELDYRIVKIMCSLEGDFVYFKDVVT